jgi:soluble lytic murein transglycosylase-like protein
MKRRFKLRAGLATIAVTAMVCPAIHAAEHVTLRNGFELDCARQEVAGDRVRLYLMPSVRPALVNAAADSQDAGYIEVAANAVLRVESIADPPAPVAAVVYASRSALPAGSVPRAPLTALTPAEMQQILTRAGALHNIDTDLLASVVAAESGGNARAVSRAGAQGLMQLMPGTASELGVRDSFAPEQNIGGGTAYLDTLLTRYGDNIALALAAYNAGPEAVDRYHGIPPYEETRAYVARVIREFNRRKRAAGVGLLAAAK